MSAKRTNTDDQAYARVLVSRLQTARKGGSGGETKRSPPPVLVWHKSHHLSVLLWSPMATDIFCRKCFEPKELERSGSSLCRSCNQPADYQGRTINRKRREPSSAGSPYALAKYFKRAVQEAGSKDPYQNELALRRFFKDGLESEFILSPEHARLMVDYFVIRHSPTMPVDAWKNFINERSVLRENTLPDLQVAQRPDGPRTWTKVNGKWIAS